MHSSAIASARGSDRATMGSGIGILIDLKFNGKTLKVVAKVVSGSFSSSELAEPGLALDKLFTCLLLCVQGRPSPANKEDHSRSATRMT